MHANSTEYRRFTVKLRDSGGFLFRSYPFLFPEVKCLSVANDQKSVWKEKFTSLNIKHSQIFLSMCFVSSVHGTLVLTQALASDYVCLEYSISQRAGRNKQNTHQEIVPQKLKSVGGSPRWSPKGACKLNKESRSFKELKSNKNSRIWLQFNKQLRELGRAKHALCFT